MLELVILDDAVNKSVFAQNLFLMEATKETSFVSTPILVFKNKAELTIRKYLQNIPVSSHSYFIHSLRVTQKLGCLWLKDDPLFQEQPSEK